MPFALLWLAACGGEEGAAPVEVILEAPTGTTLDGPLVLAEVVHGPMPVPLRFGAELPDNFEALQAGEGPPIGFAHGLVCGADPATRRDWEERVAAAAGSGVDAWSLYLTWGSLAQCGGDPEPCAWLRERFSTSLSPTLHEVDGYLLSQCDGDETRALIEGGPIGPVVLWYRTRAGTGAPWSPRLEEALRIAVRNGDPAFAHEAATLLANLDGPRADGLLLGLRAGAIPDVRDALAIAMWRSPDPKARELVSELCASTRALDAVSAQPRWAECGWTTGYAPPAAPRSSDLGAWVRLWSSDPVERAAQHPEEAEGLRLALSTCVTDELGLASTDPEGAAPWTLYTCLRPLAALDRRAAAALAPSVQAAGLDHLGLAYLTSSLLRFPREEDVTRRSREIGLSQGSAARSEAPVVTAEDLLDREGRLYNVYEGGWAWPVGYDELLADLAAMAPPLAEARFASREPIWSEIPVPAAVEPEPLADLFSAFAPEPAPIEEEPPKYVVHAWFRGERWRIEARDQGDWPDLDASLGLLNRLLEAEGSDLRYAETTLGEIALAPREALIAADREGMLDLVDPAQRYADEQAARAAQLAGGYDYVD